eukprot:TRINITY_DN4786_c0_g1_i5.p1 TRINITY_DN4786_c0_g1~~TRINITY_DN4786_c0_g1_i5.p1  ORF type:complete len:1090 (-),score=277.07 TRINITY_DN4786_c0_g1_i5:70-3318(-)
MRVVLRYHASDTSPPRRTLLGTVPPTTTVTELLSAQHIVGAPEVRVNCARCEDTRRALREVVGAGHGATVVLDVSGGEHAGAPPCKRQRTSGVQQSTAAAPAEATECTRKERRAFVGLSNQGATCYMNSLIQALFMTPEFRRALYNWSFEDKIKEDCQANPALLQHKKENTSITLQLQRLFARLQLSTKSSVKTTKLTKSFGWSREDAWVQQDVQELCRILFDRLEKSFHGSTNENLINLLWQGKLKDYVKCLECHSESSRVATYLDVPLVIKSKDVALSSIHEALAKFVQPETLDGTNQYSCDKCNKKVNAQKGLCFSSFPYILTLQLKRFDFDQVTRQRIKLTHRVAFPLFLDLTDFTTDEDSVESNAGKYLLPPVTEPPDYFDRTPPPADTAAPARQWYELYAVLVHRGNAQGGHYIADIKALDTGHWYEFSDSVITEIDTTTVKSSFGGSEKSSCTAYMLMYRKMDPANAPLPTDQDVPATLRGLISGRDKRERKLRERNRTRHQVQLSVVRDGEIRYILADRRAPIRCLLENAAKLYKLTVPADSLCLWQCDTWGKPLRPMFADASESLAWALRPFGPERLLLLRERADCQTPEDYSRHRCLRLAAFLCLSGTDAPPRGPALLLARCNGTVRDLKEEVARQFGIEPARQLLAYQRGAALGDRATLLPLLNDALRLRTDLYLTCGVLYVQEAEPGCSTLEGSAIAARADGFLRVTLHSLQRAASTTHCALARWPLSRFRSEAARRFGLDPASVALTRGNVYRAELQDDAQPLSLLRVNDGATVWVEDAPSRPNHHRLLCVALRASDGGGLCYDKVADIDVCDDAPVADAAAAAAAALPGGPPAAWIWFRDLEGLASLPGGLLPRSKTWRDLMPNIYSGKLVCIQVLMDDDWAWAAAAADALPLAPYVARFRPDTLTLSAPRPIFLPEGSTIEDLQRRIWETDAQLAAAAVQPAAASATPSAAAVASASASASASAAAAAVPAGAVVAPLVEPAWQQLIFAKLLPANLQLSPAQALDAHWHNAFRTDALIDKGPLFVKNGDLLAYRLKTEPALPPARSCAVAVRQASRCEHRETPLQML